MAVPGTEFGTTNASNNDPGFPDCPNSNVGSGVWYSVIGTGNTMTITTCAEMGDFDTRLSVFCGSCDDAICVGGNDDACPQYALLSRVTFCSETGVEYLILIHSFVGQVGDFELNVLDEGGPCAGLGGCLPKNPCLADFDNTGDVGVNDLLFLLGTWGPCPKKGDCPADFDDSGDVGVKDLLFLLGAWGPCP